MLLLRREEALVAVGGGVVVDDGVGLIWIVQKLWSRGRRRLHRGGIGRVASYQLGDGRGADGGGYIAGGARL